MRWSSPTTCGAPLLPPICWARWRRGGVLIYETFAAGNETVGKPSRAGLPAAPRRTAAALRRACAWWPTRTASSTRRRVSCSASSPCAKRRRRRRRSAIRCETGPQGRRLKSPPSTRNTHEPDCRQHRRAGHADARRRQRRLRRAAQADRLAHRRRHRLHRRGRHHRRIAHGQRRRTLRDHPRGGRAGRGRVPIMAGCGANSTAEAIELSRFAKQVGADCHAAGRALLQQADAGRHVPALPRHRRSASTCRWCCTTCPAARSPTCSTTPCCGWRRCPASSASRKPPATSNAPPG